MKKTIYTLVASLLTVVVSFAQKPKTVTAKERIDESGFYINAGKTKVTELNCFEFDELILKVKNDPAFLNFSKVSIGVKYTYPVLYKYNGFENKEKKENGEFYFFSELDVEKLKLYQSKATLDFLVANSDKVNKAGYINNLYPNTYTRDFSYYIEGLNNSLLKYTAFQENMGNSKLSLSIKGYKPNGKVEVYKENCKCYVSEITYQEIPLPTQTVELKINNQVFEPLLKINENNAKNEIHLNSLRDKPLKSNPDCYLNNNSPEKLSQLISNEYQKGFIVEKTFDPCKCSDSLQNESFFKAKKASLKRLKLKLEKVNLLDKSSFEHYDQYSITDENGIKNGCELVVFEEHRGEYVVKMGKYVNNLKEGTWEIWKYNIDGNKTILSRGFFEKGILKFEEYYK